MKRLLVLPLAAAGLACATPRYVAKVNGEEIRGDDVVQIFGQQHNALEKALSDDAAIRKYVESVVERQLFIQEASRLGLQDSPDVRDSISRFQAEKLVALLRTREIEEKAAPTDADVQAAYDQLRYGLTIRQLVVDSREKADALRARAVAGEDFEILVREESIAPTSSRGGLMTVQWGGDPTREKIVLPLAEGQLSDPFRSDRGWEVDKVEKREAVERASLETLKPAIEPVIRKRKLEAREEELRAELRKKYDAKLGTCPSDPEALRKALKEKSQEPCATWTGGKLTVAEVADETVPDGLAKLSPAAAADVQRKYTEQVLDRELFRTEAEARGWAALPEIAQAVRLRREELMERKLLNEYVYRDITASDDEVKAYYERHKDAYLEPETFALAHIVVKTVETADEVKKKLAAGETFDDLAKEYSADAESAGRGGFVGVVTKDQLTGPLAPIAALEAGGVSDAIQIPNGFHVVKVLFHQPAHQRTYEEAAAQAKQALLQEKATAKYQKWLAQLRQSSDVEISGRGIHAFTRAHAAAIRKSDEEHARRTRELEAAAEVAKKAKAEVAAKKAAAAKEAAAKAGAGESAPAQLPGAAPTAAEAKPAK